MNQTPFRRRAGLAATLTGAPPWFLQVQRHKRPSQNEHEKARRSKPTTQRLAPIHSQQPPPSVAFFFGQRLDRWSTSATVGELSPLCLVDVIRIDRSIDFPVVQVNSRRRTAGLSAVGRKFEFVLLANFSDCASSSPNPVGPRRLQCQTRLPSRQPARTNEMFTTRPVRRLAR